MQHLHPEPVEHSEPDIGTIVGGVNVYPKWALSEGHSHNFDDGIGNRRRVGVRRNEGIESFLNPQRKASVRPSLVLIDHHLVSRGAGAREVLGPLCECSRDDDGSFDAPTG